MGFEDRDYFREEESSYTDQLTGWGFDAIPPAVKYLVAANVVVFLLQIFITRPATMRDLQEMSERIHPALREQVKKGVEQRREDGTLKDNDDAQPLLDEMQIPFAPRISVVQQWAELDTEKILKQGQVWRLITCTFCHARQDVFHILFNMLFLWWFGKTLEQMYGTREFALFYFSAGLIASLAFVGLQLFTGERIPSIGASGAVMAVTVLYAIFYPRDTIRIMMIFPVEIRWIVLLYIIYDLHPVLLALSGDEVHTGVAHAAHLGGAAFGFVYWRTGLHLSPIFDPLFRLFTKRKTTRVRSARPVSPTRQDREAVQRLQVEQRLDAILEKIHLEGETSLTDEEREVLKKASEMYKNR